MVGGLSNLAAVPLIVWTANRLGKKPTLLIGVLIVAIGAEWLVDQRRRHC